MEISNMMQISLLRGLSEGELTEMESRRCMRRREYKKNTAVFRMGDRIHELGIVLSGSILIENTDLWGNRTILSSVSAGQVFAETYALTNEPMMVDAVAAEDADVLLLDIKQLLQDRFAFAAWQGKLLRNLLNISSRKNLTLSSRIFCTTPKRVRGRLLTYLSGCALKAGASKFDIPFDRQQLADYLNLDRSALSKELGIMRDEGLVTFHKNHFTLLNAHEI